MYYKLKDTGSSFPVMNKLRDLGQKKGLIMPSGVNICKFYRIKFLHGKLPSVVSFGNYS